ncbi:MAG: MerR family transcriptional regulator [Gemmatimonadota bacterium]|jgi:DNA-binding transcriptional MerR regulator
MERTRLSYRHWTVGQVARMAHVTVRTLHHYDDIGLLTPSGRSRAGYRLYGEDELERLHQVLVYRELGFPLEGIATLLDEPALDRRAALLAQRELLLKKTRKTKAVIRAVDRMLNAMEKGKKMSTDELNEGFDALADAPEDVKAQHAKYGREVIERWGGTEAHNESARRAKTYRKEDWEKIKAEGEAIESDMAALLAAGKDPGGEEAVAVAERHRQHITRWFYPCSHAMHKGLADLYEADARFTAHYEERAPGLAAFNAAAIRANSARAQAAGEE